MSQPRHERETQPSPSMRSPLATPAAVAAELAPFPSTTADAIHESLFPDWRRRLTRNLARRSDGRWEPLTWVHARDSGDHSDSE